MAEKFIFVYNDLTIVKIIGRCNSITRDVVFIYNIIMKYDM